MSVNKRVLIVGAGVAGSYLYRLLERKGVQVTICDNGEGRGQCGVHPCGFAASGKFHDLVKRVGLNPDDYVFRHDQYVVVDDVKAKGDVLAIDKPRLVKDLLKGADVLSAVPPADYDLDK